MAAASLHAWPPFALPGPPWLKIRETSLVSRLHQAGDTLRANRDARAAASRFTEPNSQDSLSLGKILPNLGEKGSCSLTPPRAVHGHATSCVGSARRQPYEASTGPAIPPRRCKPPSGPLPRRSASPGYAAQTSRNGIRPALAAEPGPVSSDYSLPCLLCSQTAKSGASTSLPAASMPPYDLVSVPRQISCVTILSCAENISSMVTMRSGKPVSSCPPRLGPVRRRLRLHWFRRSR